MRVTNQMMSQNLLYNLNRIQRGLSSSQAEISTGKVLNKPSDNPLAVSQDMADSTSIGQANSYLATIQSGVAWTKSTSSVLQSMTSTLQTIRNVTLQALNTPGQTPTAITGLQQQIAQLVNNMYQLSDTKQGNSYLFGGYATDKQVSQYISTTQLGTNLTAVSTSTPVIGTGGTFSIIGGQGSSQVSVQSGDTLQQVEQAINAVSNTTGVTASLQSTASGYQLALQPQQNATAFGISSKGVALSSGTAFKVNSSTTNSPPAGAGGAIQYKLSASVQEQVNVTAGQIFNQTPVNGTKDLQKTLQSILNDISNPTALQKDLGNLSANISHLIQINTQVGARTNQMQTMQTQTKQLVTNLQNQQASLEDVNMAKVITQYQNQMSTYQSALQMGSKILLPTLAQYIQ